MTVDAQQALGHLPQGLRAELLDAYDEVVNFYRKGKWKASGLDVGWFCEIVFSILQGHLNGDEYPDKASKPRRFDQACKELENRPATYSESARVTIPRILLGMYTMRNRRGIGHVGGDVNANQMDATYLLHGCQWTMAELVRMFHNTDIATATAIVDALVERTVPMIWQTGDVRRLLHTDLSDRDSVLVLLYGESGGATDRQLADELEKRPNNLRARVLVPLHKDRYIEFKQAGDTAHISPKGIAYVEDHLLPRL